MTPDMNGKRIREVWFPADANGQIQRLLAEPGLELRLSVTHHGDHDEVWIVQSRDGVEIARHNPRYVETVTWEVEP